MPITRTRRNKRKLNVKHPIMVVNIEYAIDGKGGFTKTFFANEEPDAIIQWCDWATKQEIANGQKFVYGRVKETYSI